MIDWLAMARAADMREQKAQLGAVRPEPNQETNRKPTSDASPNLTDPNRTNCASKNADEKVADVDFEERAAIIEFDGNVPREWAEGLARLCVMACPETVSEKRWQQAIDAAGIFCDQGWAAKASVLGWSVHDIFGVDRLKPNATVHTAGLIWLMRGRKIAEMLLDTIILETENGSRQTYRPQRDTSNATRRILLWESELLESENSKELVSENTGTRENTNGDINESPHRPHF